MAQNPVNGIPSGMSAALDADPDFNLLFQSGDLEVWGTERMPLLALGGHGLLVGKLFSGLHPAKSVTRLTDEQIKAIVASRGASLITNFWGAYVAFLREPEKLSLHAARDPSPGFPIYQREAGDCLIFATHIDDLRLLGLPRPIVDMHYVAAHVQNTGFRYRRTGLEGISELAPGERVSIRDRVQTHTQLWSPWSFAAGGNWAADFELASAMLRSVIDGTVSAWASQYHHAILGVSGGLDSSIVASALKTSGIELTLVNFLGMEGSQGDERIFVEALAHGLCHDVVTAREDIASVDIVRSDAAHLPRPVARAFSQSGAHTMIKTALACGADVIFSGGGGDNVFCYLKSSAPVADRIVSGAWPPDILRVARDVSEISEASLWQVARAAGRRIRHPHPGWLWKPNRAFLTEECHDKVFDIMEHPWLQPDGGRWAGKLEHVGAIVTISNFLEGFGYEQGWPVIYPLLSQPVMELCLQIPSWLWCENGANRAVARQAYRGALPQSILQRRSKGSCDRFCIELIERRRDVLEDFICGGALAAAGLIQKDEVREAMRDMTSYKDLAWSHILTLVDVEAWVRVRS